MIQDLEAYRSRRIEAKPMTIGANALSLKPELVPNPLTIVKPEIEIAPPIEISDFIKRKNILNAPKTEAESEKFIEREIDPNKPWSAFSQIMFIKEHVINGEVVKKIAAISIALPGGVGTRMAGEALRRTTGIEKSKFERWDGEIEGGIIAASQEVPNVMDKFELMEAYVEDTGAVISERHAQAEHEVVQHFFNLQKPRKDFLGKVKEYASGLLNNPEFTGWSAIQEEFKDKGIYLVEGIVKDGEWKGGDPSGNPVRLVGIAADKSHKDWLEWAEKRISGMKGDGILVDAEDTETVQNCGGVDNNCGEKKGCAAFFEKMEGAFKKVINALDPSKYKISKYMVISGGAGAIAASTNSEVTYSRGGSGGGVFEGENCMHCGKDKFKEKDGCKCSSHS